MKNCKRYLVTSALPYANGPVHIGHLAGCYLPADIYVRYLRMKGEDVIFVCGTDEHGVPITIRAKKEGITPQEVVDKYYKQIKVSFEEFGISFDIFTRTSTKVHHDTAQEFFLNLYNKRVFKEEITKQFYDEKAQSFLADRYIIGTCPNCKNENAYGDQCENCGTSLDPSELINPKSTLSGATPVLKETKNWFLPLDDMQDGLKKFIDSRQGWKNNVLGQCNSWITQGLHSRAMTRDLDWGVNVPLKDAEGKVLYVWFDAPIGYISATKEYFEQRNNGRITVTDATVKSEKWESYWKNDESCLIHFIGKDNIVFHCIIFPAMLMAYNEGNTDKFVVPMNVPANEFLNLEGNKISTSRDWAVWLHDYLIDFPNRQDELRYVLTSIAPENKDSDFSWKDFQARVNNEMADIMGNYIKRVIDLVHKYCDGKVPTLNETILLGDDEKFTNDLESTEFSIANSIMEFKFRDGLFTAMDFARKGNQFLAETEPWKLVKTDPDKVDVILFRSLLTCVSLAKFIYPFLPQTSKRILQQLNLNESILSSSEAIINHIKSGNKINASEILFTKITDEEMEFQIKKLADKSVAKSEVTAAEKIKFKEPTTFDEFSKMDIRIGTILEAVKVPKTEKLLKLLIDTGLDKRTVVSGIAEYFKPNEIIGKQVCILANLAPRTIKGIESNGMILMAENSDGELSFMAPTKEMENGAIVR